MDKPGQPKDSERMTKKRALENDDDKHDDVKKRKESQLAKAELRAILRRHHKRVLSFIKIDYLGPNPNFSDKGFKKSHKISRTSFYRLKDDVLKSNIPYYQASDDEADPSLEAKLMLPLQTFARGISFLTFMNYFGMSPDEAHEACAQLEDALLKLYVPERAVDSDQKKNEDEDGLIVDSDEEEDEDLSVESWEKADGWIYEDEFGVKLALKRLSKLGFSTLGLL